MSFSHPSSTVPYSLDVDVFISWSGAQAREVAAALREALPKMLAHKIKPFVSSEDIAKGDRGLVVIADELEKARFGIVVVTKENQNAPWLNFEVGALGKSMSTGKVAPLLIGLTDSDLTGPIRQFQNTEASDEKAVRALVASMNTALEEPLNVDIVDVLFAAAWPAFKAVLKGSSSKVAPSSATEERTATEMLEELVVSVRGLRRDLDSIRQQAPSRETTLGDGIAGSPSAFDLAQNLHTNAARILKNVVRTSLANDSLEVQVRANQTTLTDREHSDMQLMASTFRLEIKVRNKDHVLAVFTPRGPHLTFEGEEREGQ